MTFPESSAQIKDENKDNDSDEKPSMPAAVSVLEKKDKSKSTVKKVKRQSELASADMAARKKARIAKVPNHDGIAISETKQLDSKFGVQTEKKKRKPSAAKVPLKSLFCLALFVQYPANHCTVKPINLLIMHIYDIF